MHQAIFESKKLENKLQDRDLDFAIKTLIPCSLKFYKVLSQNELTQILKKLQDLYPKINQQDTDEEVISLSEK
jgi:hypothetical protein